MSIPGTDGATPSPFATSCRGGLWVAYQKALTGVVEVVERKAGVWRTPVLIASATAAGGRPVGVSCIADQVIVAYVLPSPGASIWYTAFDGSSWSPDRAAGPLDGDGPSSCTRHVAPNRRASSFFTEDGISVAAIGTRLHLVGSRISDGGGPAQPLLYSGCSWPCRDSASWSRLVAQGGMYLTPYVHTRLARLGNTLFLFFRQCSEPRAGRRSCGPLQVRLKEGD
jgi:hypothetical protein